MDISVRWLNRYLSPSDCTPAEAEDVLTAAGFPVEEVRPLPDGDTYLDVELTSNRGDCMSHLGLAREITASPRAEHARELVPPTVGDAPKGPPIAGSLSLSLEATDACPRFTAQLIRGVKVGPSPTWLVQALEAVGQRSINNVVDVTNYLTFELGHPCHVFDLAKLAGSALVVRPARDGEKLTTLDGKARTLKAGEIVVADADKPQSLAGVIGGADSEVGESTTDVVLELACWDPVAVRSAARRHAVRTDASARFERLVDPRTLTEPAARAAALIIEVAGGELAGGVLDGMLDAWAGEPAALTTIELRPARCRSVLGMDVPAGQIIHMLRALEIDVEQTDEDVLRCTIPAFRHDLTREIDLIEEVARLVGLEGVPTTERISLRVRHPQETERAKREAATLLAGLGFYETVTFSFTTPALAAYFLPEGLETVAVDDDRRKAEPTLRPSPLAGLLVCRKANRDAQNDLPGGLRLFERAAAFAQDARKQSVERRVIALTMDAPIAGKKPSADQLQQGLQLGLRQMRGVIDQLVRTMGGAGATIEVEAIDPPVKAWKPGATGRLWLTPAENDNPNGQDGDTGRTELGVFGLIDDGLIKHAGLDLPIIAAELDDAALLGLYPPKASLRDLPSFPGIDRDLSLILDEQVSWQQVSELVHGARVPLLEGLEFVGVFRGERVGGGKKSVTIRLHFRDPERTLRHDEVDPQVETIASLTTDRLGAEIRS